MPISPFETVLLGVVLCLGLFTLVWIGIRTIHRWIVALFVSVTTDLLLLVKEASPDRGYIETWDMIVTEVGTFSKTTKHIHLDALMRYLKDTFDERYRVAVFKDDPMAKTYKQAVVYIDHWSYLLYRDFSQSPQGLHVEVSTRQIYKIIRSHNLK